MCLFSADTSSSIHMRKIIFIQHLAAKLRTNSDADGFGFDEYIYVDDAHIIFNTTLHRIKIMIITISRFPCQLQNALLRFPAWSFYTNDMYIYQRRNNILWGLRQISR